MTDLVIFQGDPVGEQENLEGKGAEGRSLPRIKELGTST